MKELLRKTAVMLNKQLDSDPTNHEVRLNLIEILIQCEDRSGIDALVRNTIIEELMNIENALESLLKTVGIIYPDLVLKWINWALEHDKSNPLLYWRKAEILDLLDQSHEASKCRSFAEVIDENFENQPPPSLYHSSPKPVIHVGTTNSKEILGRFKFSFYTFASLWRNHH